MGSRGSGPHRCGDGGAPAAPHSPSRLCNSRPKNSMAPQGTAPTPIQTEQKWRRGVDEQGTAPTRSQREEVGRRRVAHGAGGERGRRLDQANGGQRPVASGHCDRRRCHPGGAPAAPQQSLSPPRPHLPVPRHGARHRTGRRTLGRRRTGGATAPPPPPRSRTFNSRTSAQNCTGRHKYVASGRRRGGEGLQGTGGEGLHRGRRKRNPKGAIAGPPGPARSRLGTAGRADGHTQLPHSGRA